MTVLKRRTPMEDFKDAVAFRNKTEAEYIEVVCSLPSGRVEELWDADKITLGEATSALKVRYDHGLRP